MTIEPAVISPELLPDIKTPGQTKRPHASDYWVLTKPDVNLLILVTVGAGFCLARPTGFQGFPWVRLFHTLFGTSLVASGSGVLNQVAERRFDSLMRRTARRPLASGRIAPLGALWFGIFLSAAGAIYLASAVNLLAGLLALLTSTLYLGIYTPLKRKTSFCTLVGAIPGAIPPLIGWAAASGCLSAGAWILRNAFSLAIPSLHVDRLDVQRGLCPGGIFDASARAMERTQHGLAESATGTGINSYLFDTSPVGSNGRVLCRFGSSDQFGILL